MYNIVQYANGAVIKSYVYALREGEGTIYICIFLCMRMHVCVYLCIYVSVCNSWRNGSQCNARNYVYMHA
jgi:hypothetical protein